MNTFFKPMIPVRTINAEHDEDDDDSSQLSSESYDLEALENAAMRFGGSSNRASETLGDEPYTTNSLSMASSRQSGERHHSASILKSQMSMTSKDASTGTTSSASEADNTIVRGNYGRRSFSSEYNTRNFQNINNVPDARSGIYGAMDEIQEEKLNYVEQKNSFNSCSNSRHTLPSMQCSSVSSRSQFPYQKVQSQSTLTEDELDEEEEIRRFSINLSHAASRLSIASHTSHQRQSIGRQSIPMKQSHSYYEGYEEDKQAEIQRIRNSLRDSITNTKKRGSIAEENMSTADAAAAAASFFENGNFSDDDESDDPEVYAPAPKRRSFAENDVPIMGNRSSFTARRRSSSGIRKTSFRASFSGSSLGRNSLEDVQEDEYQDNEYFQTLETIPGSNHSAMSAAAAAVAAEDAERQYEARLSAHMMEQPGSQFDGGTGHRRARRRAGFVLSSLAQEAQSSQNERLRLIEKDRIESRLGRRTQRRSMSYSAGIKNRSSIIAQTVPEDAEATLEENDRYEDALRLEDDDDFQQLRLNRVQRRVNSMPDPNAISRLSESSLNDCDLTNLSQHGRSSLTDTLEASTLLAARYEPRQSLPLNFGNMQANSLLQEIGQVNAALQRTNSIDDTSVCSNGFQDVYGANSLLTSLQQSLGQNPSISSMMSMQSTSGVQINSPHNPQTLLQGNATWNNNFQQVNVGLNNALQNLGRGAQSSLMNSMNSSDSLSLRMGADPSLFNSINSIDSIGLGFAADPSRMSGINSGSEFSPEEFDGKETNVQSIHIDPDENSEYFGYSRLLHEACKKDDVNVVQNIIRQFPLSSRWVLDEENIGNVALHIAAKSGNTSTTKILLQIDSDSALIRNAEGHAPIHIAVNQGQLAVVSTLCDSVPACAKIQCENGNLPLHDAVSIASKHPDTPQTIQALLHAFKKSVFVTNDERLLPIHLAATSGFVVGIRTLLASEFSSVYRKEELEDMLPLDLAVVQLQEYLNEEEQEDGEDNDMEDEEFLDSNNSESDKNAIINCIEILLSSMTYNRLISEPRSISYKEDGKPFLPLHSAVDAKPQQQTFDTLYELYKEEHSQDVDLLGRNIAHRLCSREIEHLENDIAIANKLPESLFIAHDDFGFIPLHLALQNRNVPLQFIEAISERHTSSLSKEVLPVTNNFLASFLPVHVAAASSCSIDVLMYVTTSYPSSLNT